MKTKLLLMTALVFIFTSVNAQLFQENFQIPVNYFHSASTDQLSDTTNDLVVMGSLFDDALQNPKIQAIRVDEISGNIIWQFTYHDPNNIVKNPRIFDFVEYMEGGIQMLALTGSVEVSGTNHVFIVKLDDSGAYMGGAYFTNIVPSANSQGMHIIYSQQGFVVGGFTNMDYISGNNDPTSGFVLRTDLTFNPMWTKEVFANYTDAMSDFDMVNHIEETNDGYFITGSINSPPFTQQSVLCLKLDFNGNFVWSNSYFFGNSTDLGVDAYYDAATDEIFLLTNYSQRHYFGVTVLSNINGTIDASKSWTAYDWDNLNRYGFSIFESASDTMNLVVSGYMRDGFVLDQDSVIVNSQSIPFVYEFEKATGNQVGQVYYYHVAYTHPPFNDYFDFWNGQMPLIYYPDMSLKMHNDDNYFHVAYRTDSANSYTNIEMIKTDFQHVNQCYRDPVVLNLDPIIINSVATDTNDLNPIKVDFNLTEDVFSYVMNVSCEPETICDCEHLAEDVAAGFTFNNTGLTVNFTPVALSANCDSVEWNFGDNSALVNSQGNQTVTHTYVWPEMFDVCMKVTRYLNDGTVCSDSICTRIDLTNVGVFEGEATSILIRPNPVKDALYITIEGERSIIGDYQIVDILGKIVMEGALAGTGTSAISTSELTNGLYIIQINAKEGILTRKFVKE